jgi:hypothetical protein
MRPAKGALKASGAAGRHPTASWAILGPSTRSLDGHATPWDEPERHWGRRGNGPVRIFRKMFRREKLLGTW